MNQKQAVLAAKKLNLKWVAMDESNYWYGYNSEPIVQEGTIGYFWIEGWYAELYLLGDISWYNKPVNYKTSLTKVS